MTVPIFMIRKTCYGEWDFVFKARNGKELFESSDDYSSKRNAINAVKRLGMNVYDSIIVIEENDA